jgi:hypothetical protein
MKTKKTTLKAVLAGAAFALAGNASVAGSDQDIGLTTRGLSMNGLSHYALGVNDIRPDRAATGQAAHLSRMHPSCVRPEKRRAIGACLGGTYDPPGLALPRLSLRALSK